MEKLEDPAKRQFGRKFAAMSLILSTALAPVETNNIHSNLMESAVAGHENILAMSGEDPWAQKFGSLYYYMTVSRDKREIMLSQSETVMGIADSKLKTIWTPNNKESVNGIWAPELHPINNKWYVYYASAEAGDESRRMKVLEANSPFGPYTDKGIIKSESDHWAIDGTVLPLNNKLYFVWSGWEGNDNVQQNLYIADMLNPWTISGDRTKISVPQYNWEIKGSGNGMPRVNEGPQVLSHNGRTFIIYSASGSWTDDYALGMLELVGDNPLKAESWFKYPYAVFKSNDLLVATGHASFIKAEDDITDVIVYHVARHPGAGWDREVRAQTFDWNSDGTPNFGSPRKTYKAA